MDVMAGDVSETGGPHGWRDFVPGRWQGAIDVRDFIVRNVTPYDGDETFLVGPSARTKAVWEKLQPYFDEERQEGRARRRRGTAVDPARPRAGLDRPRQRGDRRPADRHAVPARDLPVRRPAHGRGRPEGRGIRRRSRPCMTPSPSTARRHNDGVFDAYTPEIMRCRRVAHHHRPARCLWPRPHHRRLPAGGAVRHRPAARGQAGRAGADRRHVAERGRDPRCARNWRSRCGRCATWPRWAGATAATSPGRPRPRARRCSGPISAYLGAIKEANGAAMSIGRISTFLDIYIERDIARGHARREPARRS